MLEEPPSKDAYFLFLLLDKGAETKTLLISNILQSSNILQYVTNTVTAIFNTQVLEIASAEAPPCMGWVCLTNLDHVPETLFSINY